MDLCVKCRAELPPGALYCPACGKKQAPEKRKALKRANGTGTVYRLQGRRQRPWVAAKNRVIIGYYAKKTEALEALERLSGVDLSERYNMTFSQVFDAWKQEHYQEIGPHGIDSYEQAYKVFAPLHGRKFRELRTADFQAVLDAHMGKSHSTVSKYKQLITQMSAWAMREELITTNFARFAKLPEQKKTEKEVFSASDIAKLQADDTEAARIVLMLIYNGCRISEFLDLKKENVHLEEQYFDVIASKTENGLRKVPIADKVLPFYKAWYEGSQCEYLLHTPDQKHFDYRNYYDSYFTPLMEQLGYDQTPHCTRHTCISMLTEAHVDQTMIKKIVGHSGAMTLTERVYTHLDIETLVEAINKI